MIIPRNLKQFHRWDVKNDLRNLSSFVDIFITQVLVDTGFTQVTYSEEYPKWKVWTPISLYVISMEFCSMRYFLETGAAIWGFLYISGVKSGSITAETKHCSRRHLSNWTTSWCVQTISKINTLPIQKGELIMMMTTTTTTTTILMARMMIVFFVRLEIWWQT